MFCVTETPLDVRVEALLSGSEDLEVGSAISADRSRCRTATVEGAGWRLNRVQERYQNLMF